MLKIERNAMTKNRGSFVSIPRKSKRKTMQVKQRRDRRQSAHTHADRHIPTYAYFPTCACEEAQQWRRTIILTANTCKRRIFDGHDRNTCCAAVKDRFYLLLCRRWVTWNSLDKQLKNDVNAHRVPNNGERQARQASVHRTSRWSPLWWCEREKFTSHRYRSGTWGWKQGRQVYSSVVHIFLDHICWCFHCRCSFVLIGNIRAFSCRRQTHMEEEEEETHSFILSYI